MTVTNKWCPRFDFAPIQLISYYYYEVQLQENIAYWEKTTQQNHIADKLQFCTYEKLLSVEEISHLHLIIASLNDI